MINQSEFITKLAVDSWHTHLQRLSQFIDNLSDDQLMKRIAPKKNRGIYLLGHLTTVHDRMLPMMFFGDTLFPELNELFLIQPDNPDVEYPPIPTLREHWYIVNKTLNQHIGTLPIEGWLERHSAVSEQDFVKEPHRNRLNLLLNRTNHLSNHFGQLLLLKEGALV